MPKKIETHWWFPGFTLSIPHDLLGPVMQLTEQIVQRFPPFGESCSEDQMVELIRKAYGDLHYVHENIFPGIDIACGNGFLKKLLDVIKRHHTLGWERDYITKEVIDRVLSGR